MAEDCIFCKIRDGEIPSDILHSDEDCFVIRDINPLAPTHLLIIPNRHFAQLSELGPEPNSAFAGIFAAARAMAEREGVAESGYRLIINQGCDGGQEVMHLHMHLLGGKPLRGLGLK
jgi:histidine triad (HIT) family protein